MHRKANLKKTSKNRRHIKRSSHRTSWEKNACIKIYQKMKKKIGKKADIKNLQTKKSYAKKKFYSYKRFCCTLMVFKIYMYAVYKIHCVWLEGYSYSVIYVIFYELACFFSISFSVAFFISLCSLFLYFCLDFATTMMMMMIKFGVGGGTLAVVAGVEYSIRSFVQYSKL